MATVYFKAENEEALMEALETINLAAKVYDETDPDNQQPKGVDQWQPSGAYKWVYNTAKVDIIGEITQETGNTYTDEEGNEFPERVAVEGFHANVRARIRPNQRAALPIVDAPKTPYRKWFGE